MLCTFVVWHSDLKDEALYLFFVAMLVATGLALFLSMPVLVTPFLAALGRALPEAGTQIHRFTVDALAGAALVAYVACVIGIPAWWAYLVARRKQNSRMKHSRQPAEG